MDSLIPSKQPTDDTFEIPTNEMSTTTQEKPDEKTSAFQITSNLIPKPDIYHPVGKIKRKAVSRLYETVDRYIHSLPIWKNPRAMAIAAYDIVTGNIAVAFSGTVPTRIHSSLSRAVKNSGVGNIGQSGQNTRNIIGACAEFRAANKLLQNGSKFENIRFTDPIRPRTRQRMSACDNCQHIFSSIL